MLASAADRLHCLQHYPAEMRVDEFHDIAGQGLDESPKIKK